MHSNETGTCTEDGGSDGAPRAASRTTSVTAVEGLTDADLLAGTRRLVCQSNRVLAELLAHLVEVEARGLHRTRACASLFTYCVYELRMSEDAAYRRVAAARLVKRFPPLLGAVERGELHLTGLLQLGPHLTEADLTEVLARAQFRTKKEIGKLVRLLSPLPDVPSRIEPLGLDREEAKALLAHPLPNADLAQIHLRAMQALVAELKQRKYAHSERRVASQHHAGEGWQRNATSSPSQGDATESPRQRDKTPSSLQSATRSSPQHDALEPLRKRDATQSSPQRSRHVPAAVRRAVFERDGNRCAYVDERSVRCRETQRLELHHLEPFARGGPMTPENLSLHCAAPNALAAEGDFGRQFSLEMRESQAHFTERTLARTTA